MKHRKSKDVVLGVGVTSQLIEAVLLQKAEGRVSVLRRFIRQRARSQDFSSARNLTKQLPGLQGSDDADYTLDIGDGNGSASPSEVTFLATEFRDVKSRPSGPATKAGEGSANGKSQFGVQLGEILDECRAAGYAAPRIAFCVGAPDVSYTELASAHQPKARKASEATKKGEARLSRRALLELLDEQRTNPYDRDRAAFVPLAPAGGRRRYVAIVPEASESVRGTLEVLVSQDRAVPPFRVMDSELSAFGRLIRRMIPEDQPERGTAFVRVGADDTLILFFNGTELRHYERLRSLSTYDSPETICSRVLLQQDEQKIGEIHHVLVLSEGRSEQLLGRLKASYADAAVETLQDALAGMGVQPPRNSESLAPGSVPAVAAGLRLVLDWDSLDPDFDVHLLPRKLQRDQKKLALAWHSVAMLVVLIASAFFFSWRFMDRQAEINREREDMRLNPIEMPIDNPALLQARVDSLQQAYQKFTRALATIDSLLVGSDRWTRLHESVTRSTQTIGGIWLASMEPVGSVSMRIDGTATSRTKVAQLARRHGGSVEKASSFEIKHEMRDIRLYDFVVVTPVPEETPRVALYLQDVAAGLIEDHAVDSVLAAYQTSGLYAPGDGPGDEAER
jgi:hypothetical protein